MNRIRRIVKLEIMSKNKIKNLLIISFLIFGFVLTMYLLNSIKNDFFNNNIDPIDIDGNGAHDWDWAVAQSWCNGSGTLADPYIIEDLIMNEKITGSWIKIRDSMAYFIIQNCFLTNSRVSGIYLMNVSNGVLINNTIKKTKYGISIYNSSNIVLSENQMNGCGIQLYGSMEELLSHDITNTNMVNDKPIYYYINEVGLNSDNFSNPGQIILVNCNQSILSGLNLIGGSEGISLFHCESNLLIGNNITHNKVYGVFLSNSHNNNISFNRFNYNIRENSALSLQLEYCNNCIISENEFCFNRGSLSFIQSSLNKVKNNLIKNNEYGISFRHNCYFNDISENEIRKNYEYGIDMVFCYSNTISRNVINNNDIVGIKLYNSDKNNVSSNIANHNNGRDGIEIWWCDLNVISNNIACENRQAGIFLSGKFNTIFNNSLFNNYQYGLQMQSGDWNVIYYNQFNDNWMSNAIDDFGNSNDWDNGTIGNYWSDYNGVDVNDDGVGDSPYLIPGNSEFQDNFPIWDDGPGKKAFK